MRKILVLIFIVYISVYSSAQNAIHHIDTMNLTLVMDDYWSNDTSLLHYVQRLDKYLTDAITYGTIDTTAIPQILPSSEQEFYIYFSCDYNANPKVVDAWQRIDALFHNMAEFDTTVFVLYLNISNYVDGYYAEVYFDDLSVIIKQHIHLFCEYYFAAKQKRRLEPYFNEFCFGKH